MRIVPGVAQRERDRPDVMRGEETQLAGIASLHGADLLVCMPGTHCKWVRIADGAVAEFQTWMTGELFSVLSAHSILRHALGTSPAKVSPDDPVFGAMARRRARASGRRRLASVPHPCLDAAAGHAA